MRSTGITDTTASMADFINKLFKLHRKINRNHADISRNAQGHRGEIEDSADSRFCEPVDHLLRNFGRDSQGRDGNAVGFCDFGQLVDGIDGVILNDGAGFSGVVIENGSDTEPVSIELFVANQGSAEITQSDQCQWPESVGSKCFADGDLKFVDLIADAWVPELAKEGEVFANLGIAKMEHGRNLVA